MINDSLRNTMAYRFGNQWGIVDDLKQEIDVMRWQNPDITPFELRCDIIDLLRRWKLSRKECYKRVVANPENKYVSKIDFQLAMTRLTRKQYRVISLILLGYSNREIAKQLKRHETSVCIVKRNAIERLTKYYMEG